MLNKELVSKVAVFPERIKELESLISDLRSQLRESRKQVKEKSGSRDSWKEKCKKSNRELKALRKEHKKLQEKSGTPIARHKYSMELVTLSISICMLGNCSLRGAEEILKYLQTSWGLFKGDVPSKSSISNWIQKAGLYLYKGALDAQSYPDGYGLILDECMVIGQERLLAVLICKAKKGFDGFMAYKDVAVAMLQVRPSWNGEDIAEVLKKVGEEMGKMADYVVCDGASNLRKGLENVGVVRVCDIGHEIARNTEKVYKNAEEYLAFAHDAAQCRLKEVMKPTAYLLPPKQRTIARFMNISYTITWANELNHAFRKQPETFLTEEKEAFKWLNNHEPFLASFTAVTDTTNLILKYMKEKGLSHKSIDHCLKFIQIKETDPPREITWKNKIIDYLRQEKTKLPSAKTCWNISSDVIESVFGVFKASIADNPLYGVTLNVLRLPVITKINRESNNLDIDMKNALESVFLSNLYKWNKDNLIENQVLRRSNALRN